MDAEFEASKIKDKVYKETGLTTSLKPSIGEKLSKPVIKVEGEFEIIEDGVVQSPVKKIWCRCLLCGEKRWYRIGCIGSVDYICCDLCNGPLHDVLGCIVESNRLFS